MRYAETDQMGVVHHANYVVWFELARTRLCALSGFHYADIERLGYLLMVTGVEVRYHRPARYGDAVRVVCWCERLAQPRPALRLRGAQRARANAGHRRSPSTSGSRRATGRPCRTPEPLREPFQRLAGSQASNRASPAIFRNVGSSASIPAGSSRARAA